MGLQQEVEAAKATYDAAVKVTEEANQVLGESQSFHKDEIDAAKSTLADAQTAQSAAVDRKATTLQREREVGYAEAALTAARAAQDGEWDEPHYQEAVTAAETALTAAEKQVNEKRTALTEAQSAQEVARLAWVKLRNKWE